MSKGRSVALDRMQHMIEAAQLILEYTERGRSVFDKDRSVRDAIVYQVIVLGEAAKAVIAADPTLEHELPEIEWSLIARMRDRLTHHYWTTDSEVVWSTATTAVPELRAALGAAISRLS